MDGAFTLYDSVNIGGMEDMRVYGIRTSLRTNDAPHGCGGLYTPLVRVVAAPYGGLHTRLGRDGSEIEVSSPFSCRR